MSDVRTSEFDGWQINGQSQFGPGTGRNPSECSSHRPKG